MNKVQELLEAVKKKQHTRIRSLLAEGVDVNAKYGQVNEKKTHTKNKRARGSWIAHPSPGSRENNVSSATYNLQQTTIANFAAFSKITNKA